MSDVRSLPAQVSYWIPELIGLFQPLLDTDYVDVSEAIFSEVAPYPE